MRPKAVSGGIFGHFKALCDVGFDIFVHSFDTKSTCRLSPETFDLESSNFTLTSVPTHFTATLDMTSLSTSSLYRLWLEFIGLTNVPDMTSLAASGRLQNAIKYCAEVRKTGPAGQRME